MKILIKESQLKKLISHSIKQIMNENLRFRINEDYKNKYLSLAELKKKYPEIEFTLEKGQSGC